MNEQERVTARPQVYIDVVIDGRKQIYDVETAEVLQAELTRALNQVEATNEIGQSRQPLKPDGRTPQILGASGTAPGGASRRGA